MKLTLPVHVKQYRFLQKLFGEQLIYPCSNHIAKHILALVRLSKNSNTQDVFNDYSHQYEIEVPIWIYSKYGITEISSDIVRMINQYLSDKFKELFYLKLHELVYISKPKMKIIHAIYLLSEEWGIADDIQADSIKKDYFRYRKKNEEIFKKNTSINVLDVYTECDIKKDSGLYIRVNSDKLELLKKKAGKNNICISALITHFINSYVNE